MKPGELRPNTLYRVVSMPFYGMAGLGF